MLIGTARLARRLSTVSFKQVGTSYPACIPTSLLGQLGDLHITPLNTRSHILPLDIDPPAWPNNRNASIENPLVHTEVEEPIANVVKEIMDKITDRPAQDFELPTGNSSVGEEGIQAAVLIGIRRRKMKKHKLKKLRKKMKFEWAKVNLAYSVVS